jgi:dienelactone hydrolase
MIHTEEVLYQVGQHSFRGFAAHDTLQSQPKPCVLIAHDWSGRSETVCKKAEQLAELGYTGFAVDMYGDAKLGHSTEEKKALLDGVLSDRSQVAARMNAAVQAASSLSYVNPNKIAAIGYCFGGLCVLDLARSGAKVTGVVSFHGLLFAPEQAVCEKINAKVLVLHGYEDKFVPPEQVNAFAKEMTQKKVDWQLHMYGATYHSFTNPEANDAEMGLHYNACADRRSWVSAQDFLNEIFAN